MRRNSLNSLINELTKYGTLTFGPFESFDNKLNCSYEVALEYADKAWVMAVKQLQDSKFKFCIIACMCFDSGFNPIFDKYINA